MFKYLAAAAAGFMLGGGIILAVLFMIALAVATNLTPTSKK